MAHLAEPVALERRPLYIVAPDPPRGWRVTARRGRRGRGGFASRGEAVAHAERLASGHPIAQIRVYGGDGSLERDEGLRNPCRCVAAQKWLEVYLDRFRDYETTRGLLVDDWYVENRLVEVQGEGLWLFVGVHEGQAWDEIYVHAHLCDEPVAPYVAEAAFVMVGW
ncbi:MAG: DUF2188 domain-containing protein [Acidimicrobiia bacterium]|nr:DUF2188 domain-containing protein [Acidimicrobiia bacterium]